MVLYLPKHHNPLYLLHLPGTGVSSGTGTTYHSGTSELTSFLAWVRVIRSLAFSIVFCLLFFDVDIFRQTFWKMRQFFKNPWYNRIVVRAWWYSIGSVMVSVVASSAVDRGCVPRSGQTKNYKIGICCTYTKHAALRRKSKDWLARNQDNVS